MEVTFVDPPVLVGKYVPERVFGCTYGLYPIPNIFLLTCAAVLERIGSQVKYISCPLEKINRNKFISFLKSDPSDVYIIYSVNLARPTDLKAVELIRKIRGKVKIIFLGPGPTYDADSYLVDENIIVIRGEPEVTLKELVESNFTDLDGIKGISFLDNGQKIFNETRELIKDLDMLPLPARNLIDKKRYYNPKFGVRPFTAVVTGRGCPFRCLFCVPCSLNFAREIEYKNNHNGKKPPVRWRSAKNVVEEFKQLEEEGYKAVSIIDDEFVLNRKRVLEICEGIKDLGIKWGCLARADTLREEVIEKMAEAGCKYIDIGVESFNQEILDYIQKDLKIEVVEKIIPLVKKYGIMAKINILFGSSPYENETTIRHTMKKVKELAPDLVMFGICNPFPGTEYYKIAKEKGWFVEGDYYPADVQKETVISYPNISKKELERAVKRANFQFFLNPSFVFTQLKKINFGLDFLKNVNSLRKKLFYR